MPGPSLLTTLLFMSRVLPTCLLGFLFLWLSLLFLVPYMVGKRLRAELPLIHNCVVWNYPALHGAWITPPTLSRVLLCPAHCCWSVGKTLTWWGCSEPRVDETEIISPAFALYSFCLRPLLTLLSCLKPLHISLQKQFQAYFWGFFTYFPNTISFPELSNVHIKNSPSLDFPQKYFHVLPLNIVKHSINRFIFIYLFNTEAWTQGFCTELHPKAFFLFWHKVLATH